jgi:hypothetical protein
MKKVVEAMPLEVLLLQVKVATATKAVPRGPTAQLAELEVV